MSTGRPRLAYFIFDCPSDHEIDSSIISESETIKAVLSNRRLGSQLKCIRCSTSNSFIKFSRRKYSGVKYVHLGGHGSEHGLGFIGDLISWRDISIKLAALFPLLHGHEQRVLTLSCCYSKQGINVMLPMLKNHFSAVYYFRNETIEFSTAITVWAMFYLKKNLKKPEGAIKDDINNYFGDRVIEFVRI